MSEEHKKGALRGALAGIVTGVGFGLIGFALARSPETKAMGSVMFMLVPFAAGIAIAMVTSGERVLAAAAGLALVSSLVILVTTGREGMLCALLAFAVLLVAIAIGAAIGFLIRMIAQRFVKKEATLRSVVLLLMPLLVYGGHQVEIATLGQPRQEIVTSTIYLPAEQEQVWDNIQSLATVAGKKSLLMYVGLPIPQSCVLRGSGVGAKRICYFDRGSIEETVLEWSPPNRMRLSIDRTNMPGRHWLEFEGAEYDLQREGSGTLLTRTTTIASNLYPAWYWRRFERWGVESEHEYLFSDLARRFSGAAAAAR